jgi:CRP-like cAMP-binding protein
MIAIMFDDLPLVPRCVRFEAGEAIFRRGQPARAIYRVVSGEVAMVRVSEDGGETTIARAGPGEGFAEAALFAEVYHCDAVARSPCALDLYPTAAIRDWLARDPAAGAGLARFFARQVRELRTRIELLRIKRAPDRVLAWLLLQETPTVSRRGAWASVAGEIGLSPEAFYRALRILERRGRISRRGRDIELISASTHADGAGGA